MWTRSLTKKQLWLRWEAFGSRMHHGEGGYHSGNWQLIIQLNSQRRDILNMMNETNS